MHCFGLLWAYVVLSGDFLMSFLRATGVPGDSVFTSRWFLTVVTSVFVLTPLSWFRRVESLSTVSSFALFAILYTIIVIIIRLVTRLCDDSIDIDPVEAIHPSMSIVQCFSTLCFAFSCQQNCPIVQGELKNKSASTMKKVCTAAIVICGSIYIIAAICGYVQFTSEFFEAESGGNILTLYSDKDAIALSARLCALFVVICSYPALLIPARGAIFNLIRAVMDTYTHYKRNKALIKASASSGNTAPVLRPLSTIYAGIDEAPPLIPKSWKKKFVCGKLSYSHFTTGIAGSIIVCITMLLSIWLNKVAFVFDIIGSTASTLVCFIIPAFFYIRVRTNPRAYVNPNRKLILESTQKYKSGVSSENNTETNIEKTESEKETVTNPTTTEIQTGPAASRLGRVITTEMDTFEEEPEDEIPERPGGHAPVLAESEPSLDHIKAATASGERVIIKSHEGGMTNANYLQYTGIGPAFTPSGVPLLAAQSPMIANIGSTTPQLTVSSTPPSTLSTVSSADGLPMYIASPPQGTVLAQSSDKSVTLTSLSDDQTNKNVEESVKTKPGTGELSPPSDSSLPSYFPDQPSLTKKKTSTTAQSEEHLKDLKYEEEYRKLSTPIKMCSVPIIIALLVLISGCLFGLVSLSMAIIFDTNIASKYNIK